MQVNHVNVEAAGEFAEQVKIDPGLAKQSKRVEGRWNFTDGEPQFSATMFVEADSDADQATMEEIERLARQRCPGVYCLTHPIPLETRLRRES